LGQRIGLEFHVSEDCGVLDLDSGLDRNMKQYNQFSIPVKSGSKVKKEEEV